MKNRAIEIHDSTLDAIFVRDGEAVLHFPRVYIHESTGTPGVDAGSGWVQEALLRISDATVTRSFSKFPADLLDGHIMLRRHDSKKRAPYSSEPQRNCRASAWNRGTTRRCLITWQWRREMWN